MKELLINKLSDIPLLLDFEQNLNCPKNYEGEDRDSIRLALNKLAEWWFSAIPDQFGAIVDIIKVVKSTEKYTESNASIYFRIHMPSPVKVVLVMIQHQHPKLHDQLQIPAAEYKKESGHTALFDEIRLQLKIFRQEKSESIQLSKIIDVRTAEPNVAITRAITKLVAALHSDFKAQSD